MAKPFLKWAGGKTQLLNQFKAYFPVELIEGNICRYIEPFIGSGAVFFFIAENYPIREFFISDVNEELILAYKTIREDVDSLIDILSEIQDKYFLLSSDEQKDFFYKTRSAFNANRNKINFQKFHSSWHERAAQIIFLNRTCFNGLFRVNSKGGFNVPFGDYKNPKICDAENLRAVSNVLKNTEIECGNFDVYRNAINKKTFVYFDPPYRPLSKTASFTSYSRYDFDDESQICLANFYREIDKAGAKLMLSNSDPQNVDPEDVFFEDLYKDFLIGKAIATRAINSNGKKRGELHELVITNYEGYKMKSSPVFKDILDCTSPDEVFKYLTDNLNESITYWDYFVNWEKVQGNLRKWEVDLNTLNYLVGKENIEEEFKHLIKERPALVQLIPVLLALRQSNFKILTDYTGGKLKYEDFDFRANMFISDDEIDKAYRFSKETGLLQMFQNKYIKSIPDYVIGVEVGLDTNARKNRGGTAMETIVENFLKVICDKHQLDYIAQATSAKVRAKWGLHLEVDKTNRQFDFAVKNDETIYLIETNYYGSSGSKLKSTAGEYKALFDFVTSSGHKFIWITDGLGWAKTRKPLRESFDHLDYILNLKMITEGVLEEILSNKL